MARVAATSPFLTAITSIILSMVICIIRTATIAMITVRWKW